MTQEDNHFIRSSDIFRVTVFIIFIAHNTLLESRPLLTVKTEKNGSERLTYA